MTKMRQSEKEPTYVPPYTLGPAATAKRVIEDQHQEEQWYTDFLRDRNSLTTVDHDAIPIVSKDAGPSGQDDEDRVRELFDKLRKVLPD